ncbi:MAG: class I SAM-dependent methyltransferase [Myxococcales bacterium]|nr:class I SAM-dependent methyltransferase [Myxococcales bacterium]
MEKLGAEIDSSTFWSQQTSAYVHQLTGDYHAHRLQVIDSLIPAELYATGKRVFDFGCGNAVHFPQFCSKGVHIEGVDVAPEMIAIAKAELTAKNLSPGLVQAGGVDLMKERSSASFDAVLSFNVLAYLTNDEERTFYEEAKRILKPGGFLVVTHSNSLFDMFSLNALTADFFEASFGCSRVAELLVNTKPNPSQPLYNVRENPLAYKHKLAALGFAEVQQEFINLHPAPPSQMPSERKYASTLALPEADRWKLFFQCSTYGSRSVRR